MKLNLYKNNLYFLNFIRLVRSIQAFTLSEVLIALGIIGVVAAFTIPTLLQYNQKQELISKLKIDYANLTQAVKSSEMDNGSSGQWDWGSTMTIDQIFDTYWKPYIKTFKICVNSSDCGYSTNAIYSLTNPNIVVFNVSGAGVKTVLLPSGSTLIIDSNSDMIFVDINSGKIPNVFGKDVFAFKLYSGAGIMPLDYNLTNGDISWGCSRTTSHGTRCAAKIMRDGWQISSDYPLD